MLLNRTYGSNAERIGAATRPDTKSLTSSLSRKANAAFRAYKNYVSSLEWVR